MTAKPQPRPALRRAADGAVHPSTHRPATASDPAAAKSLPAATNPAEESKATKAAKSAKPPKVAKSDLVALEVKVPKKLRKRAKAKAEREGWSIDAAVTFALQAWTDV